MQIELDELLKIAGAKSAASHSFVVGQQYLIRTVTFYYTGRLSAVTDSDVILESAALIVDTGRFHDALKTSRVNECEPFIGPVIIARGAIVDATIWVGELPAEQK